MALCVPFDRFQTALCRVLYEYRGGLLPLAEKKQFRVGVNIAWCKGCSLCVGVCPRSVLELSDRLKSTPVREHDCIGCRQCENICPDLAITITEKEKDREKEGDADA